MKKSSKLIFLKILLSITIFNVIVVFVLSLLLYINSQSVSVLLIQSFIKDSLTQVSQSASFMKQTAKTLIYQVYYDSDIKKVYGYSKPDSPEESNATNSLNLIHSTAPYVHSIYVYNNHNKTIYTNIPSTYKTSTADFFDKDVVKILSNFEDYKVLSPVPRIIPHYQHSEDNTRSSNVYTFIFHDLLDKTKQLDNAVILNISESYMQEIINMLDLDKESYTYIIDNQGMMVSSNRVNPFLTDIKTEPYVNAILNSDQPSGYFIENVGESKSLITYVNSSDIGWRFIRVTPYNVITSKIDKLRSITLIVSICILLASLLSAYFISRQLQKPYDKILYNLQTLEATQRNRKSIIKKNLFENILIGENIYDSAAVKKNFKELNISLNPDEPMVLIMLKLDNYSSFCSHYNYHDRSLFKFGIMNIASELCSAHFNNETADIADDYVLLLANTNNSNSGELRKELDALLKSIQQSVSAHLDISISVTASSTCNTIYEIPRLYDEIQHASQYRLIYGHRSIIFAGDINRYTQKEYSYPVQKEKQLLDAIMLEKSSEAKEIYMEIINDAKSYSYSKLSLTLSRLGFFIHATMESIAQNVNLPFSSDLSTLTFQLKKVETIEEINSLFFDLFEQFFTKLDENKDTKHDQLIEKITETIESTYDDQNLSLNSIADMFGMSPVYLNRVYKKATAKSIANHINCVRLEKAKSLLLSTDKPVREIVDSIGYLNSNYFFTLFKKTFGVTPNEFRHNTPSNEYESNNADS